ncbi:MAG: type III pantothenate kinase [Candidatus Eremiobacteraeota bacterium]|nr:type III pantothenate kinase [Candidatus Eremiobacteraeota bacterium]MBC5801504.1 type III pantothenate kinase [Candidatus Eremiobacteraeota bacterium]MBC5821103.1 type III pantothenate kinase [Candidatus Eremiobacteraeota bacterium]
MLLAVDVGNTETKLGLFERLNGHGLQLQKHWRIGTSRTRTTDEFGMSFTTLLQIAGLAAERVQAIAISSVVPQIDAALDQACRTYFACEPQFFTAATQRLIEVSTERPKELGSDLLAAAVAAKAAFGTPAVVVGFGTATTFGAISREGEYLGAAIAPGIRTSIDALVERTAKLPQVALEAPNGPIGRDTVSALQAGIVFGFVGQTEALVARLKHAIGDDARVVATGGLAEVIARQTSAIDAVEPHLVLDGLRLFYESGVPAR